MFQGKRIGGVLLMGGSGERFGSALPKQFHHLSGKPIYQHTLQAFLQSGFFDEIVLSCPKGWLEEVDKPFLTSIVRIVEGGSTRQESSYRGLLGFSTPPEYVVIHDAVRPFVSQEILAGNLRCVLESDAVNTCIPSADTLVYAPNGTKIESIPKREEFLRGQTPQSFSYPLILKAHQNTKRENCTDDCLLVRDLGYPIAVVRGEERNLKITSELDLFIAEQLLRLHIDDFPKPLQKGSSLAGLNYCVIGGLGGIGTAISNLIKLAGGEVFVLSRKSEPLSLDIRNSRSIRQAFKALPPLDGLINCAGILHVGPLEQLTVEQIDELIEVNLRGVILCCKMAPIKQGGHIINVASSSYTRGRKEQSVYSCSKAGVVNFTQALAEERPDLHIHAVIPKRVNTAMRKKNFPDEDESSLLDPQTVAEEVVALLFEQNLTGLLAEVRKR